MPTISVDQGEVLARHIMPMLKNLERPFHVRFGEPTVELTELMYRRDTELVIRIPVRPVEALDG